MWRQEMLPSILHGCHFDIISSFSIQNVVPDIFDQTLYVGALPQTTALNLIILALSTTEHAV
jgi:hypothetical protein